MKVFGILAVISLTIFVESTYGGLPSTVNKCHYGDHSCIAQSMQSVISNYGRTGVKEMGLIPFDPLHVKSLKLERNPNSPVNIELAFHNIDVNGLSEAKVGRIKGFTENINENIEVELTSPKIVLKGPYSINGNVLILPIVGKGNSEIVLASTVKKCHYGDHNCIAQSMQDVISNYGRTGVKEMGLLPFDPLHVKTLKLERNPKSPVNIELAFSNVDVLGLSDVKVLRLKGFSENLNENNVVELMASKITLKGPYSVNGSVLILPIVGKGNSEIVLDDVHFSLKTKNKPFEKDGKTYLGFDNIKLSIKPKRAHFNLEGLFNGNKELSDNMNNFINENWSEIFTELQPAVEEAFGLIIKHLITKVFVKDPYESYYDN